MSCAQHWCKYNQILSLGYLAVLLGFIISSGEGGVAVQCWEVLEAALEKGAIY